MQIKYTPITLLLGGKIGTLTISNFLNWEVLTHKNKWKYCKSYVSPWCNHKIKITNWNRKITALQNTSQRCASLTGTSPGCCSWMSAKTASGACGGWKSIGKPHLCGFVEFKSSAMQKLQKWQSTCICGPNVCIYDLSVC